MNHPFDSELCRPFFHRGSENGILLVHGFTGSAAHMRKLADALAARGYTVRTINLPGHATSEQDMAKANWQMWLQACKEAALEMMNQLQTFTIGGLSMGGVLALLVAEQMKVDGCVTISAPMGARNKLLPLAGIMAPFIPRVQSRHPPERAIQLDQAYDLGYDGFPTAKGADLYRLICLARKNLFNVQCPLLCVQSADDHTVDAQSADRILENVGSEYKQKLWLHGVPHVCTISREWPAIADAVEGLMLEAAKRSEKNTQ